MLGLVEAKRSGGLTREVLMLVEHEPVITLGRRAGQGDILAPDHVLDKLGVKVRRVERGGLATYHGPGQNVAYPVFNLAGFKMGVAEMVGLLEEVMIGLLADFSLQAGRRAGQRGVWIGAAKIGSIGLAVRGGITFHGLALNRDPDLHYFDLINPCGLTGVRMTAMSQELGGPVDADQVRDRLKVHFSRLFDLDLIPWTLSQAHEAVKTYGRTSAQARVA